MLPRKTNACNKDEGERTPEGGRYSHAAAGWVLCALRPPGQHCSPPPAAQSLGVMLGIRIQLGQPHSAQSPAAPAAGPGSQDVAKQQKEALSFSFFFPPILFLYFFNQNGKSAALAEQGGAARLTPTPTAPRYLQGKATIWTLFTPRSHGSWLDPHPGHPPACSAEAHCSPESYCSPARAQGLTPGSASSISLLLTTQLVIQS